MNRNKLIIAEKPSVAKAIASALGVNRKAGAYLYGNSSIVVLFQWPAMKDMLVSCSNISFITQDIT